MQYPLPSIVLRFHHSQASCKRQKNNSAVCIHVFAD